MEQLSKNFPQDLEYTVTLDTTKAVTEGMREIIKTLFEAMILVIIVVFIFLQGWRATLIPLIAVPVSLIGTFAVFPDPWLFDQHAFALRPRAGDRSRGRRCDRRRRSHRTAHRGRQIAEGRRLRCDGAGFRAGHRNRTHPDGGLRADHLHPGHHRGDVPAVRRHHGGLGAHLGIQRIVAQPGPWRIAPEAEEGKIAGCSGNSSPASTPSSAR